MIGHAWWNLVWILLIVTLTHGQQDGDARISNIFPDITGAPEVFFDGQWGGMCAFNITSATAGVICTQLALGGGYIVGTRKRPAAVDNLAGMQCTGSEKVVASCPGARLQRINCSLSGDELVVGCKSRAPPVPLELAVTRATSASEEGAVRVEYNGVLGYICADKWEDSDAAVACDMLGYKQGRAGSSVSVTGSFFMSELSCSGTEQYLNDCPFTFMPASCASGRAASVTCGDPKAAAATHDNKTQSPAQFVNGRTLPIIVSSAGLLTSVMIGAAVWRVLYISRQKQAAALAAGLTPAAAGGNARPDLSKMRGRSGTWKHVVTRLGSLPSQSSRRTSRTSGLRAASVAGSSALVPYDLRKTMSASPVGDDHSPISRASSAASLTFTLRHPATTGLVLRQPSASPSKGGQGGPLHRASPSRINALVSDVMARRTDSAPESWTLTMPSIQRTRSVTGPSPPKHSEP